MTPNYGSPKHREGSSCVPAGSLGEWGAHDHAPVIDFPSLGAHVPGGKKDVGLEHTLHAGSGVGGGWGVLGISDYSG